jgi:RHS repeat-associated protein
MRPGGVSIAYTSFDLPKTITQGAKVVSFGYDGDEQRIRKTTSNSETLYFGDMFEQVTTGAVKEFRYYVQSPERTIAIVTRGGNEPGIKFINVDHLGSTETITNDSGVVVEKRSFDAFGARRNPQWGAPGGAFPSKTKKGFTGHEEEDEFGLVNMKGRLYDPRIARFTTTDPVIANVYNGQSFAAYSYVRNNPLAFIDPTGFAPQPILEVPPEVDVIAQTVTSEYPDDFVPDPLPEEVRESTNSMRFTTDVGTMGDGAGIGSDQGPSNGLGIMRDVLGGAAGAYGNDVLETAKGLALLAIFPPGYFAWQGYNFWSGIGGAALDGYKQDGVFGGVAAALGQFVNVFVPVVDAGVAIVKTVDAAEKGDYKQAGESGYHAVKAIATIAIVAIGAGIARGGGGGRGANNLKPDPSAGGPHSTFKTNAQGKVSGHAEWTPNQRNPSGFDQVKRIDTQYANPHADRGIPTPHVHEKSAPGGVRPATPAELPK